MSSDPHVNLNLSSSQVDPDWIDQLQNAAPGAFLPNRKNDPASHSSAFPVVHIPDLNEKKDHRTSTPTRQPDRPSRESTATDSSHQSSRLRDAEALIRPVAMGTAAVAKHISAGVESQIANLPAAKEVVSELSEKPSDWIDRASGKSDEKDRNSTKSAALDVDQEAIANLVDQILDRFPLATPTALLFAGVENRIQVDEACAQVAQKLSERKIGKTLLIDSELEESTLTQASGTISQPGLRNILSANLNWKDAIVDECKTPMHFLPVGNKSLLFWDKANQGKRQLLSEMKQEYQFICISVGDSHSDAGSFWADVCDGTFLIVSIAKTSQTLAHSAVDQLRCNGARVLGCIVADGNPT